MRIKYPAPIEKIIEDARWSLSEYVYKARAEDASWRRIAELTGMDRETARRYARTYESAARRYGWEGDRPPSCNEVTFRCRVCGESFTASRRCSLLLKRMSAGRLSQAQARRGTPQPV